MRVVTSLQKQLDGAKAQLEKIQIAEAKREVKRLTAQLVSMRARRLPVIVPTTVYMTRVKPHYRRVASA